MFKRIVAWCLAVLAIVAYNGMALNASVDPYKESEQIVSGMEAYEYFSKNHKTHNPYEGFVRYEWISFLGEFQRLIYQNRYSPKYLRYYLESSDGVSIVLGSSQFGSRKEASANYTYSTALEKYEEIGLDGTDLRVCFGENFKRITVGDCFYLYENGSLKKIMWKNDDFLFFLEFEDGYPQTPFYEKLFCSETASGAVERLIQSVNGDMKGFESQPFPWLWVGIGGAAVVIGGAVTAALILRKKRRKAAADFC